MSLLDMLHELLKARDDVKLMLVGAGQMEMALKNRANGLGIADRVIFTGYRHDIRNLLFCADIAVPSSIREGLGMNVLEAMACGIPVVAYDNRGHRSIIKDGGNGFLVNSDDYRAMAKKVNIVLNDIEIYNRFERHGEETVIDFSKESVLAQMEIIYETL